MPARSREMLQGCITRWGAAASSMMHGCIIGGAALLHPCDLLRDLIKDLLPIFILLVEVGVLHWAV